MRHGTWWRPALLATLAISALGWADAPAQAAGYWPASLGNSASAPLMRELAGGAIRGPAGWEAWCADHADKCGRQTPAVIALTPATAALLDEVFHAVHARITPEQEPPGQDVWRVIEGHGRGDCEDYALTWREELVQAGLPRGALDIAVAETEQGEIHAVLAIHTDQGTVVFDNRHKTPKAWSALPYAWLAIEPLTAPSVLQIATPWQTLPDHHRIGTAPTVTAEGKPQH